MKEALNQGSSFNNSSSNAMRLPNISPLRSLNPNNDEQLSPTNLRKRRKRRLQHPEDDAYEDLPSPVLYHSGSFEFGLSQFVGGKGSVCLTAPAWRLCDFRKQLSHERHNPILSIECEKAATELQRCWRGYAWRSKFWKREGDGGDGMVLMCKRIQRRWRGYISRKQTVAILWHRRKIAATRLQALFWGFKGRQTCKRIRSQNSCAAAVVVQKCFRGMRGRQWAALVIAVRRNAFATRIQAKWRSVLGRAICLRERFMQVQEEEEMLASIYKQIDTHDPMPGLSESAGVSEDYFFTTGHMFMCGLHDHETAWSLLGTGAKLYPYSTELLYGAAVCLQLMWCSVGRFRVQDPRLLEDGLTLLQRAWTLDPARIGYTRGLRYHYTGWRLEGYGNKGSMQLAISHYSVHGAPFHSAASSLTPAHQGGEKVTARFYAKAEHHFHKTVDAYSTLRHNYATTCVSVFECLFKGRGLSGQSPWYARTAQSFDRRLWTAIGSSTSNAAPVQLSVSFSVLECGAKMIIVPTSNALLMPEKKGGNRSSVIGVRSSFIGAETVPYFEPCRMIVLHENDIDELLKAAKAQEIRDGRNEAVIDMIPRATLIKDFIRSRVALIAHAGVSSRVPKATEGVSMSGTNVVYMHIPTLERYREALIEMVLRHRAATLMQRAYRGWLDQARWCRFQLQAREVARQKTHLQNRRNELLARHETAVRAATKIQALFQGRRSRTSMKYRHHAVTKVQKAFRLFNAIRRAARDADSELNGPKVELILRGGYIISKRPLMITVTRCGMNYKCLGTDAELCLSHVGYFYEKEIMLTIKHHNRYLKPNKKIKPWQCGAIAELLISKLAIADSFPGPSYELTREAVHTALVLHDIGRSEKDPFRGVLEGPHEPRLLKDTARFIEKPYAAYLDTKHGYKKVVRRKWN